MTRVQRNFLQFPFMRSGYARNRRTGMQTDSQTDKQPDYGEL